MLTKRGLNTMVTNNKPNVTLITHTPNPEKLIAMAAKLCYSAANIQSLDENLTDDQIHKFVRMLSQIGHESPIEHITFTFGIENISRACSHQLVRHRIASYSQQSQRYVNGEKFEYITPPAIAQSSANESYNALLDTISNAYVDIRDQLILDQISAYSASHSDFSLKRYTDITSQKKSILNDFKATFPTLYSAYEKKANEDARFILPNACTTKIICTFNARSLFNFFSHRCCNRAQWEIREVAEQMLLECKKIAPNVFAHCGPECLFGNCPEGKMSCGRQKEMRNKYGIIETEKTTHKA